MARGGHEAPPRELNMLGILERILESKRNELTHMRGVALPAAPPARPVDLRRPAGAPLRVITEIKRRSPSAGALSTALSVAERAAAYARGGADMLSVLCDRSYFEGSFEHLREAREACALPILCKEFVIDECQLDWARAFGADAVLLIVRCLSEERLAVLVAAARERGLMPFVEVTNEAESAQALAAGGTLIGVNARDLDSLQMNPGRAKEVLAKLPASVTRVHLSGIATPEAVGEVAGG
ncbi:MAG TPA: indole-3-glycerol-phosphate synthase, partial [Polyangiaceae bacterium]|nr:indole-3-glycerol-phosphate synthase [Polyangiaceae bacterium]